MDPETRFLMGAMLDAAKANAEHRARPAVEVLTQFNPPVVIFAPRG